MIDFRCSVASRLGDEPMAGTAPTEQAWLFIEWSGSWGRHAVEDSRLPDVVRDALVARPERVQLIRRHGRSDGPGTQVFLAHAHPTGFDVWSAVLDRIDDIVDLDEIEMAPYAGLLWLVCTNGRRDRCCAEVGRPITAALAERWPEETWETTHLGGHRFSGTVLALPGGHTLGRLDARSAVAACADIEAGGVPVDVSRGRAGRAGVDQVRELHVLGGGNPDVDVVAVAGPALRQSCGDDTSKPTTRFEVRPTIGS